MITGTFTFYQNGIAVASFPGVQPVNASFSTNYIGLSNFPADGYFDGLIDEFRLWLETDIAYFVSH